MNRRGFLAETSRAALGACLWPTVARAEDREPAGTKSSTHSPALIADLEKLIPRLMKEAVVPGLSIAVVQQGALLWSRGFGVRDSASKDPVD